VIKSKYLFVIAQLMAMFWLCSAQAAVITQTQDFQLFSPLVLGVGADVDNTELNLQTFDGFDESLGSLSQVVYTYDANVTTSWVYTGRCTTRLLGVEYCLPAIETVLITHLDASLARAGTDIVLDLLPILTPVPGGTNVHVVRPHFRSSTAAGFSSSFPVVSFATNPIIPSNFFNGSGFTQIIGSLSLEFTYTPANSSGGGGPVSVPEPSTLGLLALGLMGLAMRRRNALKGLLSAQTV
jgi:PEP-CTERM motif-containing protein